ncbi:Aste57867_23667 [Aphanomyces stellatus]|uniref:Aste57867_23667 protein n=1 Tax=Aphanomyces stellatus TaxID=120398 RepID=A0A485LPZ4_9STRA|nr:hypothetical protein As57867_023595 [Aphanomyces stellatus]VFU00312.1 Aste57867_23667 [Aphanomyces stellatus]
MLGRSTTTKLIAFSPVSVAQGARKQSLRTTQLALVFHRPILALAIVKHLICGLYFAMSAAMYLIANPVDLRAGQAYMPNVCIVILVAFALLHVDGILRALRRDDAGRDTSSSVRGPTMLSMRPPWTMPPPSTQLLVCHVLDVLCQSFQAYRMSFYLVHRVQALVFVSVVSCYCLVTPWFLFAKHAFVRKTLVVVVDSYLGFFVSTVFPLYVFFVELLLMTLVDPNRQNDVRLVTVNLLVTRYFMVSSTLDLVTKFVIQFSSYWALRRMVNSMHTAALRRHIKPHVVVHVTQPSTVAVSPLSSHRTLLAPGTSTAVVVARRELAENFRLTFHTRRTLLVYVACNLVWGVALLTSAFVATYARGPCPDTCVYATAPWFDLTCHCVHVELNCAARGIAGTTVDALLDPHALGPSLFNIQIRRCALPHGVPPALLTPFQSLYGIFLEFTNMTDWPSDPHNPLPDTVTAIEVRVSNLTAVPDVLMHVPASLVYLLLEDAPISTIPDAYFVAWANVSSLSLSYLELTNVSDAIAVMTNLVRLKLRGNRIQEVPSAWQARVVSQMPWLATIDLSANGIASGPWALVKPSVALELSSNLIVTVPSSVNPGWLTSRLVILDDNPYCNATTTTLLCRSKCAHGCETVMIGDFRCDYACFNAACEFDGGDCASYGLA